MIARAAAGVFGAILLLLGVLVPEEWSDALLVRPGLPSPPIKGITLLRLCFGLEGFLLIVLAVRGWGSRAHPVASWLSTTRRPDSELLERRPAMWLLAGITALGLGLRAFRLDSDLWLDEITPILDYGHLTVTGILGSYLSTNNHLLQTLLMKLSIGLFGPHEWAVRLPAMIFGASTAPALYWIGRLALSRVESLSATLLLALSYHHIFFSQNARGYAAYLLFSLVGIALFIRALQRDRWTTWTLYVGAMLLDFAALLHSSFVLAAQGAIGAAILFRLRLAGRNWKPLLQRLALAFAAVSLLTFHLYSLALPQMLLVTGSTYTRGSTGFPTLSTAFLEELSRGIAAGFGTGLWLGTLPFVALAGAGFLIIYHRHGTLAMALAVPQILIAGFLLVRGFTSYPRFFLLALPLAILSIVAVLWSAPEALVRLPRFRRYRQLAVPLSVVLVLGLAGVSAASLRGYYAVPKQPYGASLEYIQKHRKPDGVVLVVLLAGKGYRYYGPQYGLRENEDFFWVRSLEAYDEVHAHRGGNLSYLVTTFHRALSGRCPDLVSRIEDDWIIDRTFSAAIGDGAIFVWRRRPVTELTEAAE